MFDNIIVGVDGLSGGRDAVALAGRLAGPGAVIHAVSIVTAQRHPARSASPDFDNAIREEAEITLRQAIGSNRHLIGEVHTAPSVADGLHEAARRLRADLIVVGACRRGVIGRVLSGDDTIACLRGAPCPVAMAPGDFAEHPHPIRTIGLGWDGRPESEQALVLTRTLASQLMAKARATTVAGFPTSPAAGTLRSNFEAEIDVFSSENGIPGLDGIQAASSSDLAVGTLARFAQSVDLLIVGSRSQGALGRITLGSTSEDLARKLRRPLLVVPRTAQPASNSWSMA